MTSNHHAPYDLGYTRTTMAINKEKQDSDVEQISKNCPSSDCRLQLACMKSELLVIADQHAAVNTFPGLVHTARHTMGVGNTRSRQSNSNEDAAEGGIDDWGEVVTRQPYRKVRLDHLLSKEQMFTLTQVVYQFSLFIFQCALCTFKYFILLWGCSSVGRASALQAGGQEFDSPHLHHSFLNQESFY